MYGIRALAASGICLTLVLAGCTTGSSTESNVDVSWSISPERPRVGPATLTIHLTDSAGSPITGAAIEMEANMSHAGMQPVFADAVEQDSGRYTVPFEFSMAGDWFIILDMRLRGGETVERTLKLPGVRPEE